MLTDTNQQGWNRGCPAYLMAAEYSGPDQWLELVGKQ